MTRDLVRAYLDGEVRVLSPDDEPGAPPLSPAALARAVSRARRPLLPEVHRVLVAQNARLLPSPARDAHLEALRRGAAAVVTGQQVGLFLGPLYTLYKAASAVVLARALAERTGAPVVPVFWLQTEDHDLPEIASVAVPRGAGVATLAVPVDAQSRIAIAHCRLPAEIDGCLAALAEALGEGHAAAEHVARLSRHYRPGAPWAEAFAGVLGELFAPEGLVVIDPREPALARAVAPVHARALADAAPIAAALIANDAELVREGFATEVHVRAGAPLAFFHPDGAQGPRVRLEPAPGPEASSDGFAEVGGNAVHTRTELAAALAADPMRFSTSALLRPIVQDTLLPTAAYVGGPSEVAYFAQLPPIYRAFDRALPLVVPRARFRIVDERARCLLARLGLTAADAERPEAELLARLRGPGVGAAEVSARLYAPFTVAHAELAATLAGAGPEIDRALARTAGSVERAIGKLAGKVERAALYGDAALVDAVRRLRALLAPDGVPQERKLGLAGFTARAGDRAIVERVIAAIDPTDVTRWPTLRELA